MKTPVADNDNDEMPRTHANDNKKLGTVRALDPSDLRSLSHPNHREQWLELARVLGRMEAREEFEMMQKEKQPNGPETRLAA